MFPPRAGQCAYVIDGAHTEMCVTEYSNRVFVVVTQVGKLGTVFHITTDGDETALQDAAMMLRVDPNAMNDKVRVRTLIGKRDDALLSACARHVGEVLVSKGCEKCVFVLFYFGFDLFIRARY
jgi:proteasome assembly chaperone 3